MVGEKLTRIGKYLRKEGTVTSGWFWTSASHYVLFPGPSRPFLSLDFEGAQTPWSPCKIKPRPSLCYITGVETYPCCGGNTWGCTCVCPCRHSAPKQRLLSDSQSSCMEGKKRLCWDLQSIPELLQTDFLLLFMQILLTPLFTEMSRSESRRNSYVTVEPSRDVKIIHRSFS